MKYYECAWRRPVLFETPHERLLWGILMYAYAPGPFRWLIQRILG